MRFILIKCIMLFIHNTLYLEKCLENNVFSAFKFKNWQKNCPHFWRWIHLERDAFPGNYIFGIILNFLNVSNKVTHHAWTGYNLFLRFQLKDTHYDELRMFASDKSPFQARKTPDSFFSRFPVWHILNLALFFSK